MAITPFSDDVQVIHKLGDRPIVDNNLTVQQFKDKFDEAAVAIKNYINNTLLPALEGTDGASNTGIDSITGLTATNVQDALEEIFAELLLKYEKPASGIPKTDLDTSVRNSLGKADSALQNANDAYWCTYGTTTWADIYDAIYTGHKIIACRYDNREYFLERRVAYGTGVILVFIAVEKDGSRYYLELTSLNNVDTWSNGNTAAPYSKPLGGIPASDLASAVQTSLGKADSAYQKPGTGIPASDLASGVIPDDEIFWATYGITTKAEIETALANNLFVCCKYNSTVYFLSDRFVQGASIFTYTFVGMTTTDGLYIGPQIKYLRLVYKTAGGGTNTWSNGTRIVPDLATDTPSALGTAAVGTSKKVARSDHVHSMPTAADVGAIADPGSGTTGQVLKKTANGTEWANESGGGGSSDYDDLTDKPQINSVTLSGNKSASDLKLAPAVEVVVIIDDGAVTQALYPDVIYEFAGTLTALTITLNAAAAPAQYHFCFQSGSTAPTLTLPNTVVMPSGFQVEASKHYEIDILDGYGVAQSW